MSTPLSLLSRLEALERRFDELDRTIRALLGRLAAPQHPREVFLGRPIAGVDENEDPVVYPDTGNTFNVRLYDREFTPAPGSQAVADTPRTAEQCAAARTIDGRWVLENESYFVLHTPAPPGTAGDKGEWWIIDQPRIEIVEVTSLVKTGEFYPGVTLWIDPATGAVTAAEGCWILDLNESP